MSVLNEPSSKTPRSNGSGSGAMRSVIRAALEQKDKKSRQIIFQGEKLDMEAVYRVRDEFFPPNR